jgi:hypothetical protein
MDTTPSLYDTHFIMVVGPQQRLPRLLLLHQELIDNHSLHDHPSLIPRQHQNNLSPGK